MASRFVKFWRREPLRWALLQKKSFFIKKMIECTQGPDALVVRIRGTMNRAELDQVGEKLSANGANGAIAEPTRKVVFDVTEASNACLRYVPSFVSVMRKAKDAEVTIVVGSKVQREAVDSVLSAFPGSCVVELAQKSKKNCTAES
jgi:hypothetical protein